MNAAFVNIGLEKHAYLSYDDVPSSYRIHEGQAILVQVVKEAIDTKGPKLTANIEFTGKYVVYMPFDEMRAVSRKIKNNKRRQQLLQIEIEGTGGTFSVLLLKKEQLKKYKLKCKDYNSCMKS